jgi:WD40 repeat protein
MRHMERDLRDMMNRTADGVHHVPRPDRRLVRRARLRRARTAVVTGAAALALVVGGFAARSAVSTDAAPVPPAEEGKQEIEPLRNGRILHSDSGFWQGNTAPPSPGGQKSYAWDAFDQDTGSFLYTAQSIDGRVWVVGEDGLIAEFDCPPSSTCGAKANEMETFGPGPDEVTVPASVPELVQIIAFDGTVRDTLDISAAVTQGQNLSDLAWSPDGNRLAISTESDCDCEGKVWIFDRNGGDAQLVFTERAPEHVVLRDLAWSPDGRTLALLVASDSAYGYGYSDSASQKWPRLVALRVSPNQPVRADTLKVYDDWDPGRKLIEVADDYHLAFPFVWSPDGTRIAVTSAGGIAEISAEDGEVLARHPGEGVWGPLAWLRKR